MVRKILVGLIAVGMVGLPAAGQSRAPVPKSSHVGQYPLERMVVTVHILRGVSHADLVRLREGWLMGVRQQIKVAWPPEVPDSARPPMDAAGTAMMVVRIGANGRVKHIRVVRWKGDRALVWAAEGAVKSASPLPVFPPGVKARTVRLRMHFISN